MKIGGWQKISLIDYPGQVATVLFTVGCNFRCRYCHNAKLISGTCSSISLNEWWTWLQSRRGKLDAVVISGGEPTLQADLTDFIRKIKQAGFLVKLDTNGTNPAAVEQLIAENLLDYLAMDIKAPWDKYQTITGRKYDVDLLKKTVKLIINSGLEHEFRTTYVEGLLSLEDIDEIIGQIKGAKRYFVQNFVFSEGVFDRSLDKYQSVNVNWQSLGEMSDIPVNFR